VLRDSEGATKLDPCSSEASGTPTRWEEHLSPCRPSSENLKMLAVKVSTLDLQNRKRNLPRPGLQRLLLGKLLVANLSKAPPRSGASISEQTESDPAGA